MNVCINRLKIQRNIFVRYQKRFKNLFARIKFRMNVLLGWDFAGTGNYRPGS